MKHSYRKSQFLRTVNHLFLWAIFHSYVSLPEGTYGESSQNGRTIQVSELLYFAQIFMGFVHQLLTRGVSWCHLAELTFCGMCKSKTDHAHILIYYPLVN